MIKSKILLAFILLLSISVTAQTQWINNISIRDIEQVNLIRYVENNGQQQGAVWVFSEGYYPPGGGGGGAVQKELHLAGYNEQNGNQIFDHLLKGFNIKQIKYDPANDNVLVAATCYGNNLAPATIGNDTIMNNGQPECNYFVLLSFSGTGQLLSKQWLPVACTHDLASLGNIDINTSLQRVAVHEVILGDLFTEWTTYTAGTQSRQVHRDSSYLSFLEWDFSGNVTQLQLFAQPRDIALRSQVVDMEYGHNGEILWYGNIIAPIRFGNTLLEQNNQYSAFVARLKPDGTVALAKKVHTHTQVGAAGDMVYNPVNKHIYCSNYWSSSIVIDGKTYNGASADVGNMLYLDLDSSLTMKHYAITRYGDTLSNEWGTKGSMFKMAVDTQGNVLMVGWLRDSFLVGAQMFRNQFADGNTDVAVMKFSKDLVLDTLLLSHGPQTEIGMDICTGVSNGVFVSGMYNTKLVLSPLEKTPGSAQMDGFVAKLKLLKAQAPTGIDTDHDKYDLTAEIYPNPVTEMLYVSAAAQAEVSIWTISGVMIKKEQVKDRNNIHEVDVKGLAAGMYPISVRDKDKVRTAKFVKQ